ncbi:N-methyl-L-tryptophan oxidase [Streptomyces sp. NPDC048504]|uniref:N-methyl-L-tryptophan oxidase n=1 Tax=Streptomyces sp. NPDC048504 TaxID=3365559 RepID=UPI00371D13E8
MSAPVTAGTAASPPNPPPPRTLNVAAERARTPGSFTGHHFNSAGAALLANGTVEAVIDHLRAESLSGGYEAARHAAPALEAVYARTAELLGARLEEVALVESATAGWQRAVSALRLRPGDRVLAARSSYVSSALHLLSVERDHGVLVELLPNGSDGAVDLEALEAALRAGPAALVTAAHVPTSSGLVEPAAAIGALATAHGVPYLLDATQSLGQLPVDMGVIGCDLLIGTGRKFLRGPRGTGLLAVRRPLLDRLAPEAPDVRGARWTAERSWELVPDAKRFELWEAAHALRLGLGAALTDLGTLGVDTVARHLATLAATLRQHLSALPGVHVTDPPAAGGAIVTFVIDGLDASEVQRQLAYRRVHLIAVPAGHGRWDMDHRGLTKVIRASVHVYNDEDDLHALVEAVREIVCLHGRGTAPAMGRRGSGAEDAGARNTGSRDAGAETSGSEGSGPEVSRSGNSGSEASKPGSDPSTPVPSLPVPRPTPTLTPTSAQGLAPSSDPAALRPSPASSRTEPTPTDSRAQESDTGPTTPATATPDNPPGHSTATPTSTNSENPAQGTNPAAPTPSPATTPDAAPGIGPARSSSESAPAPTAPAPATGPVPASTPHTPRPNSRCHDVIVVGLGVHGSGALRHLAARGLDVLGLEQFGLHHDLGSSHGATRMIRRAYPHPDWDALVDTAYQAWAELEGASKAQLVDITGGLYAAPKDRPDPLRGPGCREVDAEEAARIFPGLRLPIGFTAVHDPHAGIIDAQETLRAQLTLAERSGAHIHDHAPVLGWEPDGDEVVVRTGKAVLRTRRLVLCAGPWTAAHVPSLAPHLTVTRIVNAYFAADPAGPLGASGLGSFSVDLTQGLLYGFPAADGRGLKAGLDSGPPWDPQAPRPEATADELALLAEAVAQVLPGAGPVTESLTCLYTMTADRRFIVGEVPGVPQALVASACSGHGFKFGPAIGEALADLVCGIARPDLDFLSPARLFPGGTL